MNHEKDFLGVRVHGIVDDDLVRLKAFLRIGSDRLTRTWRVTTEDRFDALILGQSDTVPMYLDVPTGVLLGTLRLLGPAHFQGQPGELRQPLEFEPLVEQLCVLEARATQLPTLSVALPSPPAVGPQAVPAEPLFTPALRAGCAYRLERLPAPAVLRGDRRLLTLASLLTIRAMRLEELAAQSGMTRVDCENGLSRLLALDLLVVTDPAPSASRDRVPGAHRRAEPVASQDLQRATGVLARLRDRIGRGGH